MIRPSFKAKKVEGRKSPWRVYIPPTLSPNGRAANVWGKSKETAESRAYEYMAARRSHGDLIAAITPHQLAEAVKAIELLKPHGIGLLEAVASFLADREKRAASKTFRAAFDAFEARTGRSKDYNDSVRHTRAKVQHLLDKKIVDVSVGDLENALKGLSPSVHNLRVNRLRTVFGSAVKKGWLESNPADRLELIKSKKKDEVEIYHAADVKRLLDDALKNDKELVPFLVVAAFCGLRPEREAFNLEWKDIHLDDKSPEVLVRPELSKTRRKRNVPLSDNAIEWLKAAGVKKSGRICDFSDTTLIRKRAKNHERTASEDQAAVKVVKDGLRHAFCSAHLVEHDNITKSLLASGHTDSKVFWGHYYRAMSKEEAAEYWTIKPEFVPQF
jgi:integrase